MVRSRSSAHPSLTQPGARWRTSERLLDRAEMIAFAEQWDPLPLHVDPGWAETTRFGGIIASGLYTLAVYQSLVSAEVLQDQPVVAARALERVGFLRPSFPGDRVHADVEVVSATPGAGDTVEVEISGRLVRGDEQLLDVRVSLIVADAGAVDKERG